MADSLLSDGSSACFPTQEDRTLRSSNQGSIADTMAELERSVSMRTPGGGIEASGSQYNSFQDVSSAADQVVQGEAHCREQLQDKLTCKATLW